MSSLYAVLPYAVFPSQKSQKKETKKKDEPDNILPNQTQADRQRWPVSLSVTFHVTMLSSYIQYKTNNQNKTKRWKRERKKERTRGRLTTQQRRRESIITDKNCWSQRSRRLSNAFSRLVPAKKVFFFKKGGPSKAKNESRSAFPPARRPGAASSPPKQERASCPQAPPPHWVSNSCHPSLGHIFKITKPTGF